MQELIGGAPVMLEYLDAASAAHFESLKRLLEAAGIAYAVNPRLVRGLDYYSRTVFEWVTDALGAQGAICSGGRYDGLVEKLGGRPTPAVGWAMGIERFVDLYGACGGQLPDISPDVYIVAVGEGALEQAFAVAEEVHDALPALRVDMNLGDGSFKAQLKRADKSNASLALVLGEEEIAAGRIGVKPLRSDAGQGSVPRDALVAELKMRLNPAAPDAD
jgi:histidyl-tRNA synthetase